jgi:hypothetical protein
MAVDVGFIIPYFCRIKERLMLLFKHAQIVEVFGVRQVGDVDKTKEKCEVYTIT